MFLMIFIKKRVFFLPFQFPCINQEKKAKKKKYDNSGYVCVESIKVTSQVR